MFVKKDLRKIPEILEHAKKRAAEPPSLAAAADEKKDDDDVAGGGGGVLTELRLARRPAEFAGGLSVLCNSGNVPALRHLISLSLYDCRIKSLEGIGLLGARRSSSLSDGDGDGDSGDGSLGSAAAVCPDLRELNVGRNPLTSLPDELASLSDSLTTLWCDDCSISGPLPSCLLELRNLESLRMSNNAIDSIPEEEDDGGSGGLGKMTSSLRVLCLDGNRISNIPSSLSNLTNLELLDLRKNGIESLPEGVPGKNMSRLKVLHVSSNALRSMPASVAECPSLERIYANGNRIETLPEGMGSALTNLTTLNLSTNKIMVLPGDFFDRFGEPDPSSGVCDKDVSCKVRMEQNPVVERVTSKSGGPDPMDICT